MKHATAESTEPRNENDEANGRAVGDGEQGPPKKRSAAAKATSGWEERALREDREEDFELVDERDLLDEMGFSLEQVSQPDVKLAPRRPKAPDLPDQAIRSESPALEALARIEAREPDRDPSLAEMVDAEPLKHPPPPRRPLPPVPVLPASLRVHVDESPVTVRERRRRKPIDRPVELPAYAPGAVTLRSQRPRVPAARSSSSSSSSSGLSWGWLAAIILIGAGAYAAGTLGAHDERGAATAAVARTETAGTAEKADTAETAEAASTSDHGVETSANETRPEATRTTPVDATPEPAPEAAPREPIAAAAAPTRERREAPKPAEPTAVHARSSAPPGTSPVSTPPPSKGIDASAASSTLARAGAKAMSCTDPRGGDGTVSVTFLPSGSPIDVKMNGRYDGTAVANCVEQIFRATRVAPFEGPATTVYHAVRLPGDGKPIN